MLGHVDLIEVGDVFQRGARTARVVRLCHFSHLPPLFVREASCLRLRVLLHAPLEASFVGSYPSQHISAGSSADELAGSRAVAAPPARSRVFLFAVAGAAWHPYVLDVVRVLTVLFGARLPLRRFDFRT